MLDESLRDTYIRDIEGDKGDFSWTDQLKNDAYYGEFFTQFAGQGRVRWHYGISRSILAGNENTSIVRWGRGWLERGDKARTILVKGPEKLYGLRWFDPKCFWQIGFSLFIVAASVGGAFIISYSTPTGMFPCVLHLLAAISQLPHDYLGKQGY